jgi:hypothetical protein
MMKIRNVFVCALGAVAAAAMLAGCSASQPSLAPSAGMDAVHVTPDHGRRKFGYISSFGSHPNANKVLVFAFPGGKFLGTISVNEPQGECTKGRATWWVVSSGSNAVEEFKVGGTTPIRTLSVTAGEPAFCSIDQTTGDLAVNSESNQGDVVIFKDATGSGQEIADGLTATRSLGYDGKGDLFVDGEVGSAGALVELPAGSSTFERITLPNNIQTPNDVQWDGTYVALESSSLKIYRYSVSGSTATLEGTVDLACEQFWIEKSKIVCPDPGDGNAQVYAYPSASLLYTWTGSFDVPISAVVVDK